MSSNQDFADEFMQKWHADNGEEYTGNDSAFYRSFMRDFEKTRSSLGFTTIEEYEEYWRTYNEKQFDEIQREVKEAHQHDEYIEDLNHEEWGAIDRFRAWFVDGRPRAKKIRWIKNPNYIGPKPEQKIFDQWYGKNLDEQLLDENKTEDPWN